ncbi:hypothetical protein BJY01DRAFT_215214 [Aspergillus pseudoustus]|uniref:Uncharacterized protein n=1 Tax=Aspergillus pseudoustus TaxID=1810923 RepID=A0ABR4JVT8_9EURO
MLRLTPRISALRLPLRQRIPPTRRLQTTPSPVTPVGPFTVTVQGPHVDSEDASEHTEPLLDQLKSIPKDTTILTIGEDPPSDTEWGILGKHFTGVRDLTIDTGFNEDLNDRLMPTHWPLDKLKLSGPCGEVTKSPHILQGTVAHLILNFASELRFEGPTSNELSRAYDEAIKCGEKEKEYIGDSGIQLIMMSSLALEWLANKYPHGTSISSSERPELEPENRPVEGQEIRLRTLEIIENDAIDTFQRMSLALPHIVDNLTSLNIRSTSNPPDPQWMQESFFLGVLKEMTNLETFHLSIGETFQEEASLPGLFASLPPNLTTLHIRGPASLAQSERWEEWVTAFGSEDFLPKLQRLAFVLDLHYKENEYGRKELEDAPGGLLREARAACDQLCDAARRRGVKVEPLTDEWAGGHVCLRPVDERWDGDNEREREERPSATQQSSKET